MKLLWLSILWFTSVALWAQSPQTKKELKPFNPPDIKALSPIVAKDEGCAKDLARSLAMEGVAQRKFLVDLLTYQCIRVIPGPASVHTFNLKEFGEAKRIRFSYVDLMPLTMPNGDANAKGETIHGWVLSDELYDATWAKGPKIRHFAPDMIDLVLAEYERNKKR